MANQGAIEKAKEEFCRLVVRAFTRETQALIPVLINISGSSLSLIESCLLYIKSLNII